MPANGLGGSRATSLLVAHFALQNTASNSAEKKNRPREGVAEGGFGGNSATPERNQIVDSPATCPNTWRAEHRRKILFSLKEEKIGRAQNKKSKEYFSVVWRGFRAVAGLASLLGVLLKKCSNFVQKTPPDSIGGMRTVGDGRWRGPIACAVAFLDRRGGVRPLEDGMADDGSRLVAVARETDRIKASAIVDALREEGIEAEWREPRAPWFDGLERDWLGERYGQILVLDANLARAREIVAGLRAAEGPGGPPAP